MYFGVPRPIFVRIAAYLAVLSVLALLGWLVAQRLGARMADFEAQAADVE